WKAGFYVRFGGDTLQFGPTFNAKPEDLDRVFDAVGQAAVADVDHVLGALQAVQGLLEVRSQLGGLLDEVLL
ncbi:hypothetical protein R0G64_32080, partial [Pseudomonas otitidis]